MAIDTLNFPDAAPLNYQDGQVRHFSADDGFGVEALQRPTRMLAARDNIIRDKVNEVVDALNNREQYVNIPILSTLVPASSEEVVANFNIPSGFQARVINARVATSLTGQLGVVKVMYSTGFGNSSGADVLAAATTAMTDGVMDTEFRANGELIVSLVNQGTASARLSASVLVTLRPLGDIDGALVEATVGAGIQGPPGPAGPTGATGPAGPTGTTSYGLRWRGAWVYPASSSSYFSGESYVSTGLTRDVVTYTDGSSNTSSWVCVDALAANTNTPPSTITGWAPLAKPGSSVPGATGPAGPAGDPGAPGLNFRGEWQASTAYAVHDVVVATDGSVRRTWHVDSPIANSGSTAPASGSHTNYTEMFGSSTGPYYSAALPTMVVSAGSGYSPAGANDGDYGAQSLSSPITVQAGETVIEAGPAGGMVAFLTYSIQLKFKGAIEVRLPWTGGATAARINWSCNLVQLTASSHGRQLADTLTDSGSDTVDVFQPYPIAVQRFNSGNFPGDPSVKDSFRLTVSADDAVNVAIQMLGITKI